MIKIELPLTQSFDSEKKAKSYSRRTKKVLDKIRQKLPDGIKATDFDDYWIEFKYTIWDQQQGKCCFCEQKIHEPNSRIDHYRPKPRIALKTQNRVQYIMGYWWLAYEWNNFLVLCETCNRQKGDKFPLAVESSRAHSEETLGEDGRLGAELPLLINPRFETPENLFEYDDTRFMATHEI